MTEKNIHEAINAVMQAVGYVRKQKAATLNYTFAGEAALIQALRPEMVEHGIYMSVAEIKRVDRTEYTTGKGTLMQNTIIAGTVRFTHAPTDTHLLVDSVGEGSDTGDKSANKALTGMYKYAIRQTFMIETGDDPDKQASEERGNGHKTTKAPQQDTSDLITADAWGKYLSLLDRAQAVNVPFAGVNRAKTTLTQLRTIYKELDEHVKSAEAQAKVGA